MAISFRFLIATLVAPLLIVGCNDRGSEPRAAEPATTDSWLGEWVGPEGTFLRLKGSAGNYDITIQNLDGPLKFEGRTVNDTIQFERDGIKEFIRASNGAETGMKWLSDKSNCLTIRPGEGYCRD